LSEIRKSNYPEPLIIPRSEHTLSRADVSKNALKVLYRLKDAGYQAFLVGGGVRDILLGNHPKDFDIATDAHPERVRELFGNGRLIGRRFRLAHIRFGREIIEVATFRAAGEPNDGEESRMLDHSGRIISDNVYGTVEEDAVRRDFTVNALYYNIADFSIWAFGGGLADLKARRLRLIGDPEQRYREDPVRMLRAARFAAKLGFKVDAEAAQPIPRMAKMIDAVPPARLFDEFLKMFQSGHALASYRELRNLGLFGQLFPATIEWLDREGPGSDQALIEQALKNTDQRVVDDKPITPMFLFGVFLWPAVRARTVELSNGSGGLSEVQALMAATSDVCRRQSERITLPRRFSFPMREMLQLQPRFQKKRGRRAMNLLSHRRFRAAYDLMLLRTMAGEVEQECADFWTEVQTMSIKEQCRTFGLAGRQRRSTGSRRNSDAAP
jgi:poly(A) polymerase